MRGPTSSWRRRARHLVPVIAPVAAALLLARAGGVQAAAFLPGPAEPDPPTGDTTSAAAAEPLKHGEGFRFEFAPWQIGGLVALDGRWLRLEDGLRTRHVALVTEVDFASWLWQPWFVQVRAGIGGLVASDRSEGAGSQADRSTSGAATGRLAVSVFPQSRFPFELRADVTDSRAQGESLGGDYRAQRLSLTQSWRPETGNTQLQFVAERSRLTTADGADDTVDALRATALWQRGAHSVDGGLALTRNTRSDTGDESRIDSLNLRHSFQDAAALQVDTLASWNDVQLRGAGFPAFSTDIRQLSSFATWRPREGDALYRAGRPLYVTASARWMDAGVDTGEGTQRARTMNGALGLTQELSRQWRVFAAGSGTVVENGSAPRTAALTGNLGAQWSGDALPIGAWSWQRNAALTVGATRATGTPLRETVAAQASHGVVRAVLLGEGESLALNVTQALGVLSDSQTPAASRTLAHSASLYWQSAAGGSTQSYAGLTLSESRTRADADGRFRLVNLQFSRRTQIDRHASWSGDLTLQATCSDSEQVDALTGLRGTPESSWQHYGSGTLSYEHQRAFGVPRLRFSALLAVNSVQFERRALGDIDAPRERVTESLENRLDYTIGRLDARLSARVARVEGRGVAALFLRVQRRF
ncbi:MAG: hypothetical protein KIT35_20315 [Piscinibacter sp.]|uniref:hypothetical protein n=1 Tax=Piscinibacter TaxID=1114981 RepID=UPI000FDF1147|nr:MULTISPECIES: hypothetical protein [Piscinibacter]MCW5666182.1 hypothetical protein [Piscinibacter sp.]